jgi:hypothetical protein
MAKDEDRKKKKKRKSVAAESGTSIIYIQANDNDTYNVAENAPVAELTQAEDDVAVPVEETVQDNSEVDWLSVRSNVQV